MANPHVNKRARGPAAARRPGATSPELARAKGSRSRVSFPDRVKSGHLDHVTGGKVGRKLKLSEQYRAMQHGDVARRLHLNKHVGVVVQAGHVRNKHLHHPGHHPRHGYYHGLISPHYRKHSFAFHYWGHHYFAGLSWYPHWDPWVHWSWYYHIGPIWDPRPIWCRPVVYVASPHWGYWQTPVWVSLPVATSGTWVDVPQAVVAEKVDLQLLAVRFVDPGHPEEKLGPRYRVWFRNNGNRPIKEPFNVMLFAANDEKLAEDLPQAGVQVTAIEAGDTQSVDVRLPIDVFSMGRDDDDKPIPFSTLHVLVDAHRKISETSETNNGTRIVRAEILPVDPAAFEVKPKETAAGTEIVLAGEGFGPEPGQLLIHMAGLELEGEILGWYDLGVRATLPMLPLAGPTEAELIVVRGDGAAANPVKVIISPAKNPD